MQLTTRLLDVLPATVTLLTDGSADLIQVCMCVCACACVAMTLINPYPDIWHDTACAAVS